MRGRQTRSGSSLHEIHRLRPVGEPAELVRLVLRVRRAHHHPAAGRPSKLRVRDRTCSRTGVRGDQLEPQPFGEELQCRLAVACTTSVGQTPTGFHGASLRSRSQLRVLNVWELLGDPLPRRTPGDRVPLPRQMRLVGVPEARRRDPRAAGRGAAAAGATACSNRSTRAATFGASPNSAGTARVRCRRLHPTSVASSCTPTPPRVSHNRRQAQSELGAWLRRGLAAPAALAGAAVLQDVEPLAPRSAPRGALRTSRCAGVPSSVVEVDHQPTRAHPAAPRAARGDPAGVSDELKAGPVRGAADPHRASNAARRRRRGELLHRLARPGDPERLVQR